MTDPYAMWDAAYVLGSLSGAERREYETHLGECGSCRSAVAELGGMPALLAMLTPTEAGAIEEGAAPPPVPARVLDRLIERVGRRRRRQRWAAWAGSAAAAAVLAVGVLLAVGSGPTSPPAPPVATVAMTPVAPSSLEATVSMSSRGWGTHIEMTCTYRPEQGDDGNGDDDAGDELAMFAVSRDGTRVQLATWMAREGATATPSGSTSMPMTEIAAVQVAAADTGEILLQRTL